MSRHLVPSLALAAAFTFAACGVDPTTVDTGTDAAPASDSPAPEGEQISTPVEDPAGGIQPADGVVAPVEEVVTGRVVEVDRDGPSVEIVESSIVTGSDATDAARAAGVIGPDEEWTEEFFVAEAASRWVDIDPDAVVVVYDCTQACEHVEGTIEHVLTGAPYGGSSALWNFVIEDGRATSVEELYLP